LTRVFDPFVEMSLIIAISDKSIEDAWQVFSEKVWGGEMRLKRGDKWV